MVSNQSLLHAGYTIYTIKQKKNLIFIIPFNSTYFSHFTEMETESLFLFLFFWITFSKTRGILGVWVSPVYIIMVHDQWHPLRNVKLYPVNTEKTNSEGESV